MKSLLLSVDNLNSANSTELLAKSIQEEQPRHVW